MVRAWMVEIRWSFFGSVFVNVDSSDGKVEVEDVGAGR